MGRIKQNKNKTICEFADALISTKISEIYLKRIGIRGNQYHPKPLGDAQINTVVAKKTHRNVIVNLNV